VRSSLRARFALLAGALVLAVGSLVALGGYLTMRHALLSRAEREARDQAGQLAATVDTSGASARTNQVDITDPSLTHELPAPGFIVEVTGPTGAPIQSSATGVHGAQARPPVGFVADCLRTGGGHARLSRPPLALACERVGSRARPAGTVSVGAPLANVLSSLATLRNALLVGVLGGALLAGVLALLLARRAIRPIKRIAQTAETIRSGERPFARINYRGHDELGALAAILDACFAELEEAFERQRRFGADASHELRTPLAAIRANVELLRGWAAADPAAREAALASLDQASRRAARLVEDLLYLARVEHEPSRARAPVRLDELVLSVVREATPLRAEVAIRIARLDEVTVSGDALGLQQLMLNLLDNALRLSPAGGTVTVTLEAENRNATVSITDEGPGIEPEQLERIFERLYTRPKQGADRVGSGLGLAIARAIANDHNGELTARNQTATGATLILTLPTLEPARRAPTIAGVLRGGRPD
jgi:signal transduction histidine kinase